MLCSYLVRKNSSTSLHIWRPSFKRRSRASKPELPHISLSWNQFHTNSSVTVDGSTEQDVWAGFKTWHSPKNIPKNAAFSSLCPVIMSKNYILSRAVLRINITETRKFLQVCTLYMDAYTAKDRTIIVQLIHKCTRQSSLYMQSQHTCIKIVQKAHTQSENTKTNTHRTSRGSQWRHDARSTQNSYTERTSQHVISTVLLWNTIASPEDWRDVIVLLGRDVMQVWNCRHWTSAASSDTLPAHCLLEGYL